MAEILTQDEINKLLDAISIGDVEPAEITRAKEQQKCKIYDFRRPDKFTKDQIRTLQMIHEVYAHLCTKTLFQKLHTSVGVYVASVDQLTYEEFIRSIPNPTTLIAVEMSHLGGKAVLEIDPSITYAIIHTLFGGENIRTKMSRE